MPIIQSLLDLDFYKLTMGQLVFKKFPKVQVKYAFKNRTDSVKLAQIIPLELLSMELEHARTLRLNNSELHYLRGTNEYQDRMFSEEYLQFLKDLQLPPYRLGTDGVTGQINLLIEGDWATTIYWETIALAIINELYFLTQIQSMSDFERDVLFAQGKIRLAEKIHLLKAKPEINFAEFGTRRRFSRQWQDYVVKVLAAELPKSKFIGTSNTLLAMKHGLLPIGTSAHELPMIYSGIFHDNDNAIRQSHNQVLTDWWQEYDWGLSVALTDTFGTQFFFQDMTKEQAEKWKGLRQDSGDPFEFGEATIKFYEGHGIDPREKLIIFSDGLDVLTILKLADRFQNRIKVSFGWGTNLTNDLGLKPLSLVIKAVEANGHGTVKLSDNLAKAMGHPDDVARFKKVFGYTNTFEKKCTY